MTNCKLWMLISSKSKFCHCFRAHWLIDNFKTNILILAPKKLFGFWFDGTLSNLSSITLLHYTTVYLSFVSMDGGNVRLNYLFSMVNLCPLVLFNYITGNKLQTRFNKGYQTLCLVINCFSQSGYVKCTTLNK